MILVKENGSFEVVIIGKQIFVKLQRQKIFLQSKSNRLCYALAASDETNNHIKFKQVSILIQHFCSYCILYEYEQRTIAETDIPKLKECLNLVLFTCEIIRI